jgi:dTDP-4-amino-4,6-dideoxygalactose transaminase
MKTIRTVADLAIHGAAPAFTNPLHVGRPNVGDQEAFLRKAAAILESRWLTNNGALVQELERRIADMHGVAHCVAMCNGTIALEIAIRALGMDGEVIIPSYTFIATAHALWWQGITPVFADVDPGTHNLDPDSVRRMITPRTSGIIGVHLWGRPAPVDALQSLADEHGLSLMFDAAHAFGATAGGRRIGGFGKCEVLSFHATKVFNTFEGGAVLTNDEALADTMRLMRNFGFAGFDNVIHPGTNGKMPEINAAMGLVNLESLEAFISSNKERYDDYARALGRIDGIRLLEYNDHDTPNFQYVVIEVDPGFPVGRNRIVETLQAENILARRYFWPGCHRMKPYRDLFPHAGLLLPGTEQVADRVVVLPTGASLVPGCVETVSAVLSALAA